MNRMLLGFVDNIGDSKNFGDFSLIELKVDKVEAPGRDPHGNIETVFVSEDDLTWEYEDEEDIELKEGNYVEITILEFDGVKVGRVDLVSSGHSEG